MRPSESFVNLRATIYVAALLLLLSVLLYFSATEPSYQGERLSTLIQHTAGTNALAAAKAEEALRSLGNSALPYLLNWMQYSQPRWARFVQTNRHVPKFLSKDLTPMWHRREWQAELAAMAIVKLGPCATNSVRPLTITFSTHPDATVRHRAIFVLYSLQRHDVDIATAIPTLLGHARRQRLRAPRPLTWNEGDLSQWQPSEMLKKSLAAALENPDPGTREEAQRVVDGLRLKVYPSVPAVPQ